MEDMAIVNFFMIRGMNALRAGLLPVRVCFIPLLTWTGEVGCSQCRSCSKAPTGATSTKRQSTTTNLNAGKRMSALERITKRVNRNGDPDDPRTPTALLTLAEFFDGNDVVGSIGCNLIPTPTPAEMREVLEGILERPDVKDIRVQVTMFDDPEWPFSDTVWLMTSAPTSEIAGWFPDDLAPDDVWEGWQEGVSYEPYEVPEGVRPVACWWD